MSELDQLLSQINSGQMSSQKLKELQEMANAQLLRYEQALRAITKNGDSFTFEDYKEALGLGSGGDQGSMSRSEWDQLSLFPEKRINLRNQLIDTIKQGQQQFLKIKAAIDAKLVPKQSGSFIATTASRFNALFGKATDKAPQQEVQTNKEAEKSQLREEKIESGDIQELKALEKDLCKNKIPIDRDLYNALLTRIADSKNKEAISLLQSTAKAAEEFIVIYKQAGLDKKPGAWILKANAQEIMGNARSAIEKLNSEA